MIAKTADGLLGANNAMNVIKTPMKVFKEARARGDKAGMDRAMGYVEKAHDEAWEKKYSADEGLKQESEENRLKAEQTREELTERIRKSFEELEKRTEGGSAEGSVHSDLQRVGEGADVAATAAESANIIAEITEAIPDEYRAAGKNVTAPVTYNKAGGTRAAEIKREFSVKV